MELVIASLESEMDNRFGDLCIATEKKKTGETDLQEVSQEITMLKQTLTTWKGKLTGCHIYICHLPKMCTCHHEG